MARDVHEKDYLSIKEFAEFVGMSRPTLRYYDKAGLFHPAKLGDAAEHKYRYYSKAQLTKIRMIHILTEIGVPLETIKELEEGRTPEKLLKVLRKGKNEAIRKIRLFKDVCTLIDTYVDLLNEGISVTENDVDISEKPAVKIVLGELNDYSRSAGYVSEFTHYYGALHGPKLNISYPIGGYWECMADFMEEPARPARFYSYDPKGQDQKKEGLYINGYTRSYYGCRTDLSLLMEAYAKKNGMEFIGPVYSLYLFDEISMSDPEKYLMQISVAVRESRHTSSRRPNRLN